MSFSRNYGKNHSRSIECKCDDHFTCGHCMKICADRNTADRVLNPLSEWNTVTKFSLPQESV